MGNRAVVYCVDFNKPYAGDKSISVVSPGLYLHWNGNPESIQSLFQRLVSVMEGRNNDAQYASARLTAIACGDLPGNLSVGLFESASEVRTIAHRVMLRKGVLGKIRKADLEYLSDQGLDNGIYLIDTNDWLLYQVNPWDGGKVNKWGYKHA